MASFVPIGSGPPPDDDDGDFDYFDGLSFSEYAQKQRDSDEDDDVSLRRNKSQPAEVQNMQLPAVSQKAEIKAGPKSLTFSNNAAQCKRASSGPGQWKPKFGHVGQRSQPTASRQNTGVGCSAFPKKNRMSQEQVDQLQNQNIKDTLCELEGIPVGSYEENNSWLRKLEEEWGGKSKKEHAAVVVLLEQCWFIVKNPYVTTLYLVSGTKDYTQGKTSSLSFLIAKEFERWIKPNREKYRHCINRSLRVSAFQVAVRGHLTTLELLSKAFELKHDGNDYFLPLIDPLMKSQKYKEVAQCVTKLGLQNYYKTKEILLPLILQDKINLVEAYCFQNADEQMNLLKLLDYMVDDDVDLDDFILENSHVPDIRRDKMTPKLISKLAVRLMKLYNITEDVCPNITNERNLKGIRYLLYKRYCECSLSPSQFEELVQTSVTGNPYLQEQLIDLLLDYHDMDECVRWSYFYEVDLDKLPPQVQQAVLETTDFKPVQAHNCVKEAGEDDDSAKSGNYHSLLVGEDCIHWVEGRDTFMECLEDVGRPGNVVGIDGEWRPSFGQVIGPSKMSLLQLALPDKVYLLDIMTLSRVLTPDDWGYLTELVFCNETVIKLGYGLEGDLRMLVHAVPCLSESLDKINSVVDLEYLHHKILKEKPDMFDVTEEHHQLEEQNHQESEASSSKVVKKEERGLSELVRLCMKRPLDKSEQLSDWERRPLRQQQIYYAALDAFCLLEVYEVIKEKVSSHHLDIPIEPGYRPAPKASKKTKSEKRQKRVEDRRKQKDELAKVSNPPKVTGAPMSVADFNVVVDTMLQGLGKQLRSCGVDVKILATADSHDKAAEIARKDNRVILTSGMPFLTLRSQVPEGMCFNVNHGITAKEQLADVLEHFNVVVSKEDIFSRCKLCNGNKYVYVQPKEMKEAWNRKKRVGSSTSGHSESADNNSEDCTPSSAPKHAKKAVIQGRMPEKTGTPGCENNIEKGHVTKEDAVTEISCAKTEESTFEDVSSVERKSELFAGKDGLKLNSERKEAQGTSSNSIKPVGIGRGASLLGNKGLSPTDQTKKLTGEVKDSGTGAVGSGPRRPVGIGRGADLQRYWASYGRGRGMGRAAVKSMATMATNRQSGPELGQTGDREVEGSSSANILREDAGPKFEETQGQLEQSQRKFEEKQEKLEYLRKFEDPNNSEVVHEKCEAVSESETAENVGFELSAVISEKCEGKLSGQIINSTKKKSNTSSDVIGESRSQTEQEVEYTIEDFLKMGDDDSSESSDLEDADFAHIDMSKFTLSNGVKVQLDKITDTQFDKIDLFYVCETCGKVYWDGSHFDTVKSQLSHVIDASQGSGKSLYDIARDLLKV